MNAPGRPMFSAVDAQNDGRFSGHDWTLFASISLLWGSSFLLIDIGLESLAPELITWLRVALGAAALAALPARKLDVDPDDRRRVVLLSFLWVALPFTLFPLAQQYINSAVTGLLNGGTPTFTALVSTFLVGRVPRGRQRIGIVVGFIGVALMSAPSISEGSNEALGVALVLLATVSYGFAINLAAPLQARYGSTPLMTRVLLLGTLWTAPLGLWGLRTSTVDAASIAAVLFLGIGGTGLAFWIMSTLVGRVGSTRASFITYLIPVVSLGLGVAFRGDQVALLALVGAALAAAGAFFASRAS